MIALLALLVAGIPLVTSLGYSVGRRGRDRRARGSHAAAGGDRDRREAHRVGSACPQSCALAEGCRTAGSGAAGRAALTRRPWWAILGVLALLIPLISVPLAEPRPGGHRRHAEVDHRAPGLRPDVGGLRRRLQRPAPGRGRPREPGEAEQRVHERSTTQARACRSSSSRSRSRGSPAAAAAGAGERAQAQSRRSSNAQQKQLEQQQASLEAAAGGARASGESGQAGARADPGRPQTSSRPSRWR